MNGIKLYQWLAFLVLIALCGSAAGVPPVKTPRPKFQEAVPRIEARPSARPPERVRAAT